MGYGRSAGRVVAGCLLVLAAVSGGCHASVPILGRGAKARQQEAKLQEDLRLQLELFAGQLSSRLERMVNEIQALGPEPEIERVLLSMRLEIMPAFRSLLRYPDARIVYLDMWAYVAQLVHRLETGEDRLGIGKPLAEAAARDLLQRIHDIGATFLEEKQLAEVERDVQTFASEQPLGQQFSTFYAQGSHGSDLGSTVSSIVTAPLSAINPFGGIDATAVAIHDAASTGDRIAGVVEQLPDVLRWQVEMVIFELRQSSEVKSLLDSIEEVNATTAGLSETARTLPENVRKQVGEILTETEATQASLRETLGELNGTLKELQPVMASAERTTTGVTEAGLAWEGTARAIQEMVASFSGNPDALPEEEALDEEPGEPFRILDYAETAEQLASAAAELGVLLTNVRSVVVGGDLDLVAGVAKDTANSAVDHVVFRVGELVLVILAAAIVLRAFWTRTRPATDVDSAA